MEWFFMPETIKMLKDLWEDDHKTLRLHLNETKIEEMERLLSKSMDTKMLLEITTWTNDFFTSRVGFVTKMDPLKKEYKFKMNLNLPSILISFP